MVVISVITKYFSPIQKSMLLHYLRKKEAQMVKLGKRLKELHLERKMTQKQIADRLGLAISAVSAYESGDRYPTYDTLITLARIYHVSTDYLLGISSRREIDVTGLDEEEILFVSQLVELLRKKKEGL